MSNTEEQQNTYYNPQNYNESGGILGGLIKTGHAIESGILGVGLYYTEYLFLFEWPIARYIIAGITIIPTCIFALAGFHGRRLTEFIVVLYYYFTKKRRLTFKLPNCDDITIGPSEKNNAIKDITSKFSKLNILKKKG